MSEDREPYVSAPLSLQSYVAQMVEARGYRQGWEDRPGAYAARQVVKLCEEVAELAQAIEPDYFEMTPGGRNRWRLFQAAASELRVSARFLFDDPSAWEHVLLDARTATLEAPDVAIPLLALADTLGIDLEALVRAKVAADVARGVR